MSVHINAGKCKGCGRCVEVCPGNLIKLNDARKACIKHARDCWGCTSCLKECQFGAIDFFLGADVGGSGSTLTYEENDGIVNWVVNDAAGNQRRIQVNKKDANQY